MIVGVALVAFPEAATRMPIVRQIVANRWTIPLISLAAICFLLAPWH